jgi:hypothetical protein
MNTGNKVSTAIESIPATLCLSSIYGDLWQCEEAYLYPTKGVWNYEVGEFLEHIDWSVSLHILNYDY